MEQTRRAPGADTNQGCAATATPCKPLPGGNMPQRAPTALFGSHRGAGGGTGPPAILQEHPAISVQL